jgi:hypothetical protein
MKIHMIGHASLLVETQDARVLMDPVLWDPFCEGLNETCPKREVFPERLPEFDFLVISHQHLDHFDLRSLAYLPKHVDVLIPPDPLIKSTLQELGYRNVYALNDFQKVKIGSTILMPTRSEIPVPEFGMVFADPSGVFWNTVDTYFAPPTIRTVQSHFPQIDFLLSTWHISLEVKYQLNQSISFPFALYGELLRLIQLISPEAIAPGAQGWKYINEAAWQNRVVFPVTRERFCHDVAQVLPDIRDRIYVLNPGDTFTLDQGTYHLEVGGCEYARMVEDDRDQIEFSPVTVGSALRDANPANENVAQMHQVISQEMSVAFSDFIQENLQTLFASHCQWQVVYQLEVVFPDGQRTWQIDFSQADVRAIEKRNPLANFFTYITASSLYALIQKRRDWDYLFCSGEYRQFHKVYQVSSAGLSIPPEGLLEDPLSLKYSARYVAGGGVKAELAKLKAQGSIVSSSTQIAGPNYPMLNLGNMLIKVKGDRFREPVNS